MRCNFWMCFLFFCLFSRTKRKRKNERGNKNRIEKLKKSSVRECIFFYLDINISFTFEDHNLLLKLTITNCYCNRKIFTDYKEMSIMIIIFKTESITKLSWIFRCLCPDGWFGPLCSHRYNLCDFTRHNCSSGSTCVPLIEHYECDCPIGRSGKFCEKG